jgi:hypothetical protein
VSDVYIPLNSHVIVCKSRDGPKVIREISTGHHKNHQDRTKASMSSHPPHLPIQPFLTSHILHLLSKTSSGALLATALYESTVV